MKILSVQFKNLNSLKGEWKIDFNDAPFVDNALFAITGPTGAGKTTILDAICLALYHKTPRIRTISTTSNELMTRGTGECSAEVVFAVKSNQYIASWSMKRARGKADGKLQGAQVSLAERESGEIIASQIKQKLESIEELSGLDFERFTKSMLLSQGDFAAFLNAEESERAELLEELTGTEVYGLISQQVHHKFTDAKQQKALLQARTEGIELLEEQELMVLGALQCDIEMRIKDHTKLFHDHRTFQLYWDGLAKLEKQLENAQQNLSDAESEDKQAQSERLLLKQCQNALLIKPYFEQFENAQKQLRDSESQQLQLTQQVEANQAALPRIKASLEQVEKELERSKAEQETFETQIVTQVMPLDSQLTNLRSDIEQVQAQHAQRASKIAQLSDEHNDNQASLKQLQSQLASASELTQRFPQDEALSAKLPLWQHQLSELIKLEQQATQQQQLHQQQVESLASLQTKIQQQSTQQQQLKSEHEPKQTQLNELEKQLAELLSPHDNSLAVLNQAYEQQRSVDAVFIDMNRIQQQALEAQREFTGTQKGLEQHQQTLTDYDNQRAQFVVRYKELKQKVDWLRKIVDQADVIAKLRQDLNPDTPCLVCGSRDHALEQSEVAHVANEKSELQQKEQQLQQIEEAGQELKTKKAALEQQMKNDQALLSKYTQQIESARAAWQELIAKLTAQNVQWQSDLLDVDPLTQAIADSRAQLQQLSARYSQAQQFSAQLDQLKRNMQQSNELLQQLSSQLQLQQAEYQTAQTQLEKVTAEQQRLQQLVVEDTANLSSQWQPYINVTANATSQQLTQTYQQLEVREQQWQQSQTAIAQHTKAIEALQQSMAQQQQTQQLEQRELDAAQQKLNTLTQQQLELASKRQALFGDKRVEDERAKLKLRLAERSQTVEAQQRTHSAHGNEYTRLSTELSSIEKALQGAKNQCQQSEMLWNEQLAQSNFASADEYQIAIENQSNIATWIAQFEALDARLQSAKGEQTTIEKQLAEHNASKAHDLPTLEETQAGVELHEKKLAQLQEELGEVKGRRERDKANRQKLSELLEEIEKCNLYYDDISYLHGLIGSSSGDKFRKFAQSLTLDNLVYLANQRLTQLHGRYRLKRNPNTDLQFNVVDNWQADVERDTKTLSGGESFLVSLSLALALSDLVSHKTSIDSLFLDEGFGTLDNETLDVALDALDNLQTSGKMVGVISHIDALKERIPTQIVVSKKSGLGVSELEPQYKLAQ